MTTIDVVAIDKIIDDLERLHRRCEEGILQQDEAREALVQADTAIRRLLPADSDLLRYYEVGFNKRRTLYWKVTHTKYVDRHDCENITHRLTAVRSVLSKLAPEFLGRDPRAQQYFPAGDTFEPLQALYRILKRATTHLDIIDQHLDVDVFDFVDAMDNVIGVRLLTGDRPKPLFTKQLATFRASRREVAARSTAKVHDRFVILDNSEIWQLGTSINGLGKKASMINRVDDAEERDRIFADFNDWWAGGTEL